MHVINNPVLNAHPHEVVDRLTTISLPLHDRVESVFRTHARFGGGEHLALGASVDVPQVHFDRCDALLGGVLKSNRDVLQVRVRQFEHDRLVEVLEAVHPDARLHDGIEVCLLPQHVDYDRDVPGMRERNRGNANTEGPRDVGEKVAVLLVRQSLKEGLINYSVHSNNTYWVAHLIE